jgi:hypothetical protein
MTAQDKVSRPFNITIDTKFCASWYFPTDTFDVNKADIISQVDYTSGTPVLTYVCSPSGLVPLSCEVTLKTATTGMSNYMFLTEDEYFLEKL